MGILHKKVINFNSTFSAVVIPQIHIKYLLHDSHNSLGYTGATTLYHFIKRLSYFQGVRKKIHQYVSIIPQMPNYEYTKTTLN